MRVPGRRLWVAATMATTVALTLAVASIAYGLTGVGRYVPTFVWSASARASAQISDAVAGSGGSNPAVAETQAASLLASITLPPGSTSSASEPAGGGAALARPASYPTTPNLVDGHAWWVVPGTPKAAIAFIEAHPPQGSKLDLSGSATIAPGFQFVGFTRGSVFGVLMSRVLIVEMVRLSGGDTGLRVDAQVVWITARPTAEQVPSGVARLTVEVTRGRQRRRVVTLTNHSRIRRAVSLINSLPAEQPASTTCPTGPSVADRLTFESANARPLASIAVNFGAGCVDVNVVIGGHKQAELTGDGFPGSGRSPHLSLATQLGTALGVPQGNSPHGQFRRSRSR